MNYYPFHIGDYLSATRHLSWEEDAAYRRLLDTYYTNEKPLPCELRAVCRLVLATTDSQGEAVETVLGEFFELTADGWINSRADAEIQSMREKQVVNEVRDSHERERMRRHRERRAEMFAALRAVEIVPPWDVSIKELQRLHDEHCNAVKAEPKTDLQREQVVSGNATATAIPTPTPTPVNTNTGASAKRGKPAVVKPEGVSDLVWSDFLAIRKAKRAPLTATALEGIEREAKKAAMNLADVLALCCTRGWQGFKADWVANAKPTVAMPQSLGETAYQRSMRERMNEWAPSVARQSPTDLQHGDFIDAM